ncbi:MAG: phosphate ABC transporter substrate-binding protein PstS family protein [Sarcina sp.]
MKLKSLKILALSLAVVGVTGIFAGCGGSTNEGSASGDSGESVTLSGEIKVDGSSTVAPITEAMAEEFNIEHKNVKIPVGISGTGGGFKRFTIGETDIQDASRPIKDSEKEAATANGVEYIDLTVAYDGVTVAVSKDNDFIDSLTVDELKKIWEPNSTVKTWKDVRSEWPEETIKLYTPGPDSGTFEFFTEQIVGEAKAMRSDVNPSEDDNVLVQGVSGDKSAIGFFGYSYYKENEDKLKAVKIDAGKGAIEPSFENIENGSYAPLSREIYIYINKASMERAEVLEFAKFYLTNAPSIIPEVGYIPLTDDDYKSELEKIK